MASFDNGVCRGNDDDATATTISVFNTCAVIITNKNTMVKTIASVGDDDSGISEGDGRQSKGPVTLFYKKKSNQESKVNKSYQVIIKDTI